MKSTTETFPANSSGSEDMGRMPQDPGDYYEGGLTAADVLSLGRFELPKEISAGTNHGTTGKGTLGEDVRHDTGDPDS